MGQAISIFQQAANGRLADQRPRLNKQQKLGDSFFELKLIQVARLMPARSSRSPRRASSSKSAATP